MQLFAFQNKSSEAIPAYGCGRLKSILSVNDGSKQPIYELVKPDGVSGLYVVNGPNNVAVNAYGVGVSITHATLVLLDDGSTDDAPEFGETCGPAEDRWAATVAGTGLTACGQLHNKVMPVTAVPQGVGGVQGIRFQLTEVFCELCQATARVLSRPPGIARVYGEDLYGYVTVFDLSRGWLREPDIDLVDPVTGIGRVGHALLLEWETEECAINPDLAVKWEIISLVPLDEGCPVE